MAIFFFFVGLEIKMELRQGSLASIRKAILPCIAAVGGMVTPMLVYFITQVPCSPHAVHRHCFAKSIRSSNPVIRLTSYYLAHSTLAITSSRREQYQVIHSRPSSRPIQLFFRQYSNPQSSNLSSHHSSSPFQLSPITHPVIRRCYHKIISTSSTGSLWGWYTCRTRSAHGHRHRLRNGHLRLLPQQVLISGG